MPEGHTIHRAAVDQFAMFGRQKLRVTSPQGRFADGAKTLDKATLRGIDAYGKHLLYRFAARPTLHVHLGLYGDFYAHANADAPPPRPTTRVRLIGKTQTLDLIGPNQCELLDDDAIATLRARLGPDPLRDDADVELAWQRIHTSKSPVGQLLMDQSVISGVGNIFRAEVLWLQHVDPRLAGNAITRKQFDAIWHDTVRLMRIGQEHDRIVTVDLAKVKKPIDQLRRDERFNVYKRKTCPTCGTAIEVSPLAGRTVYLCPTCQPDAKPIPEHPPKTKRKSSRQVGR